MNRNEYLRILAQRLSVLPADEYNNTMQYYAEYFEEAGPENEANVMAELGDVNALANKILQENGQQIYYYQPPKKGRSAGINVLLAFVTIPLWIVMGSLVFSFGVTSFALLTSSLVVIGAGIAVMGASIAAGIAFVGAGCIVIAVGMGMLMATCGTAQGTRAIFRAIFKSSQATV